MSIKRYWTYNKLRVIKAFPPLFAISLVYFLPLIINNHLFREPSLWRSHGEISSYSSTDIGRIFLETWMSFFSLEFDFFTSGHNHIIYTGTANILLSIAFLIIASIVLYSRINRSKINFYYLTVIFSFLINPFFLDSLQHRTGCLYILPMTAIIVIAACINSDNKFFDVCASSVLIYFSICTYQIGFNIFFATTLLIFLSDFQTKARKKAFSNLLMNLAKISLASIQYKLLVLDHIKQGPYITQNTELIDFNSWFFKNCATRFVEISKSSLWILTESRFFIVFAIISILFFSYQYISKHKDKIGASVAFLSSTLGIIFFCCGFSVFFKSSVNEPRMYGVIAVLFIFVFHSFHASISQHYPKLKFISLIPILYFAILTHSCAAMQESEYELSKRVTYSFISKLEDLGYKRGDSVTFSGAVQPSLIAINSINKNKILKRLHYGSLSGSWYSYLFTKNFGLETQFVDFNNTYGEENCHLYKALYRSRHYKIAKPNDGNLFLVAFENGKCYRDIQ